MADFRFKQKSSKAVNGKTIARYERGGPMPTLDQIDEMESRIAELRR